MKIDWIKLLSLLVHEQEGFVFLYKLSLIKFNKMYFFLHEGHTYPLLGMFLPLTR